MNLIFILQPKKYITNRCLAISTPSTSLLIQYDNTLVNVERKKLHKNRIDGVNNKYICMKRHYSIITVLGISHLLKSLFDLLCIYIRPAYSFWMDVDSKDRIPKQNKDEGVPEESVKCG